MIKIALTIPQLTAAKALKEGKVVNSKRVGIWIIIETEKGKNPYIWRNNGWRPYSV